MLIQLNMPVYTLYIIYNVSYSHTWAILTLSHNPTQCPVRTMVHYWPLAGSVLSMFSTAVVTGSSGSVMVKASVHYC